MYLRWYIFENANELQDIYATLWRCVIPQDILLLMRFIPMQQELHSCKELLASEELRDMSVPLWRCVIFQDILLLIRFFLRQ